jgi:pyruvate formate lyase activating enzyme
LQCVDNCPTNAITLTENKISIDNTECSYCLECIRFCPSNAIYTLADAYKISDLIDLINKDFVFFKESGGGVTLSGGEPFYQSDFLLKLISELKKNKIDIFIDTSGYFETELIDNLSDVSFLYDLKVIDNSKHFMYTGVSNDIILKNLIKCDKNNINTIISIPLIPGLNTDDEDINDFVDFIKSLKNIKRVRLLKYHDFAKSKYKKLGLEYKLENLVLKNVDELYNSIRRIFIKNGIDICTGD